MANNVPLTKKLVEAGKKVHERLWELPLFEEYESEVKGTFSDLKNLSFKMNGAYASSILGAKFLEQFVGKTPWAHLDIAGTAILDASQDYMPQNGTGFGVRLLIEYLSK
jgi:leucyl aminopeptidase